LCFQSFASGGTIASCWPDGIEKAKRLRIETDSGRGKLTLRLIGRLQAEHIAELKSQIESISAECICLKQVTLVDVDVVRFLADCEDAAISIVNCAAYIREWMNRERRQTD
jgi:hypothetical protein